MYKLKSISSLYHHYSSESKTEKKNNKITNIFNRTNPLFKTVREIYIESDNLEVDTYNQKKAAIDG